MFERSKEVRAEMEAKGWVCLLDWYECPSTSTQYYWNPETQRVIAYPWKNPEYDIEEYSREDLAGEKGKYLHPTLRRKLESFLTNTPMEISQEDYYFDRIRREDYKGHWFRSSNDFKEITYEETLINVHKRELSYWIYSVKESSKHPRDYRFACFNWNTKRIGKLGDFSYSSKREAFKALKVFTGKEC
jgi:hypothetical protein